VIFEVVRIVPSYETIPIPFGMGITEAWGKIQAADLTKTRPWPKDTLIKGYVTIIVRPGGRIVGVVQ
jgi:hypothetical protein